MNDANEVFFDAGFQPKGLKPKILLAFTGLLAKASDEGSAKFALNHLFKPYSRRKYDFRTKQKPFKTHKIKSVKGKVTVHHFKNTQNKHVLLSHGWADTSVRFTHLIDHLYKEGYDVWALDQIGHGKSDGDTAHLFGFIDGVKECVEYIERLDHNLISILGHSMGALAVLNQNERHLKNKKIIMMSAPTKFFENLFINTKKMGVSHNMTLNALEYISRIYNVHWSTLSPNKHLHKIAPHFLLIHDKDDKTCSYENFKELVEHTNHDFMTTEALGHLKILKDKVVHKRISDFISKE